MSELLKKYKEAVTYTDDNGDSHQAVNDASLKNLINLSMDAAMKKIDKTSGLVVEDGGIYPSLITRYDAKKSIESLKEES